MGVYRRKRSRFLWIKYHQNGRVVRESTGTTNETVARRMLRVREGDVERGVPIDPKVGRITFDEAATDLLNDYKINDRRTTVDAKRRIEKYLKPFFKNRRMSSITASDVRAYVAERRTNGYVVKRVRHPGGPDGRGEVREERRPVSAGEINRELTVLKRMFSLTVQSGKLHHKPYIPLLREDNVRTGFFEADQYHAVLKRLPESMRPVVMFAYVTGWRINSEVLPLEWRRVDLSAGEVRLDRGTTKNGEGRVLYLTPELQRLLEQQRELADRVQREKGMIVPFAFFHCSRRKDGELRHLSGQRISQDGFYHAWRRAREAAGHPGRIPHDFRRTAIRNMVRAGIPERVAMALSGHKTRSVFERYNVVSDGDLREAARRLGHTFGHSTAPNSPSAQTNSLNS
ncbi:MAG: site-specific integrase [Acidobacteria bacterium]|nr:site-specific integrase [Acidobacteriota bacterium]